MAIQLHASPRDLGGFTVTRTLPHAECKMVGPFIFFDRMGPADFKPGQGINVRPHPHIGLATISYLLEGSMLHRDSLGSVQEIVPGDVNWMVAGRGIVHSERETVEVHARQHRLDGIQCWIALPEDKEEVEPSFQHVPASRLPCVHRENVMMRIIAGEAFAQRSPVATFSPMFYIDVLAGTGSLVGHPVPEQDAAAYIISGRVRISGNDYGANDFIVLDPEETIETLADARYLLLGGQAFEKEPIISWNFVTHSPERLRDAMQRWQRMEFPLIPGDDLEFIPLPSK